MTRLVQLVLSGGRWDGCVDVGLQCACGDAHRQGWQVNIHTIGDRANHVILNAIEAIAREVGVEHIKGRFRLEHAQIMTLPDIKRAAELGGRSRRALVGYFSLVEDVLMVQSSVAISPHMLRAM